MRPGPGRGVCVLLAAVLALHSCTSDEEPAPEPTPPQEPEAEEEPPQGLRVAVVLPPRDVGTADEVELSRLEYEDLPPAVADEVLELRAVVPDGDTFVGDVATLFAAEGFDVVCVFGRQARAVVTDLASRHAGTEFCAAPADPAAEAPDNVRLVDVALAELGHVVGVAAAGLAGDEPVGVLETGRRAGAGDFVAGLRAGAGQTPLLERRATPEEAQAEVTALLDEGVAALVLDAGPEAGELAADGIGVPVLLPDPLTAGGQGALRWRVRWDVVLSAVLSGLVAEEEEVPATLRLADSFFGRRVFEVEHGPAAGEGVRAAVEDALAQLQEGLLEPEEPAEDAAPGGGGPVAAGAAGPRPDRRR